MLTQPIHTKYDVYTLRFQDYKVGDKVYPLILKFTFGHSCLAGISPLGEQTIIWHLSRAMGRLCFSTYAADMKECDAPESNSTTAKRLLIENVPMTTSGASWASSTVT
jgi:hypothetical protein